MKSQSKRIGQVCRICDRVWIARRCTNGQAPLEEIRNCGTCSANHVIEIDDSIGYRVRRGRGASSSAAWTVRNNTGCAITHELTAPKLQIVWPEVKPLEIWISYCDRTCQRV